MDMPVEFSVDADVFRKELAPFFAGRARGKQAALDYVDITASKDTVEFLTAGMASNVTAQVVSPGYARLPFMMFEALFRRPQKLGDKFLVVRVEDGIIVAGPTTLKGSGITIRPIGGRIADVPIDAPLYEVLALVPRFTAQELVEAGLWRRVLAAQEKADGLIERAAEMLSALGVDQQSLRKFVLAHIRDEIASR
jgi:hypothetical protein